MRTLSVSIYERLKAAYRVECERQIRKLRHEIEVTETIAGANSPAVAAAKAALGEGD
jgi:hypothetical protein